MNPLASKYADRLLEAGVAGTNTSHGAENNLYKIELLREGDADHTLGMEELLGNADFKEVYEAVA